MRKNFWTIWDWLAHPMVVFIIAYLLGYAMGLDINYMECDSTEQHISVDKDTVTHAR